MALARRVASGLAKDLAAGISSALDEAPLLVLAILGVVLAVMFHLI